MRISLIKKNKIYNLTLPSKIAGSYWLCDEYKGNSKRKIIAVSEKNNKWILRSNVDSPIIINSKYYEEIELELFKFYTVFLKEEKTYATIYCQPVYDSTFEQYDIRKNTEFSIGSNSECAIFYKSNLIEHNQATLYYQNNRWSILNNTKKNIIFVNNRAINQQFLQNGDIVFIQGLKIIIINNTLFINNPRNLVVCNERFFNKILRKTSNLNFSNVI